VSTPQPTNEKEKQMSDTGIQVSPEILMDKYREIEKIDDQLGAASGGKNAGRTALANKFADANKETIDKLFGQLVEILDGSEDENRAGIFRGLTKQLNEKYSEPTNEYLDTLVKENKSVSPETVSPEMLSELSDKRKVLKSEYDALRNILTLFGESVPAIKEALVSIPTPKKLTGARGPRAMSRFQFSVDGKKLEASENTLSKVAELCGFEPTETEPGKTVTARKQLSEALATAGLNQKEPDDTWQYQVNGHTVSGELLASDPEDDVDSEEEATE
jgi:hypothetical protein